MGNTNSVKDIQESIKRLATLQSNVVTTDVSSTVQSENNITNTVDITVDGSEFICGTWTLTQDATVYVQGTSRLLVDQKNDFINRQLADFQTIAEREITQANEGLSIANTNTSDTITQAMSDIRQETINEVSTNIDARISTWQNVDTRLKFTLINSKIVSDTCIIGQNVAVTNLSEANTTSIATNFFENESIAKIFDTMKTAIDQKNKGLDTALIIVIIVVIVIVVVIVSLTPVWKKIAAKNKAKKGKK